jgi:hypothetical protein
MTGRTRQTVVYSAGIQSCVVETRNKSAASLMALLTQIRRRRVRWAFADGSSGIACDMATYARLGLDGWILVVDRIGFQEIACRRVTRIAFPAFGIDCGMHRIAWMGPGGIGGIVVRTVVAGAATCGVRRVNRIHKRISIGKSAGGRAVDAGTVGCIRVTIAAINRRGDVTCRLFDHDHAIVRFAIVTAGAVVHDASSSMVKCWHCETGEPSVMTHQTILPRRR